MTGPASDVQGQDRFWIKAQPYSLQDMLVGDDAVAHLVGGTVYQAYLRATNYHRWHSPVADTILRAFVAEGTYYSEAPKVMMRSSRRTRRHIWLNVATRATFIIAADNPAIGLLAVVQVGMSDVSSCVINPDVEPGRHVAKGDELGYFQFGGSTYCLVFGPGVVTHFAVPAIPHPGGSLVPVRSHLATVVGLDAA